MSIVGQSLEAHGQAHLLSYLDELNEDEQQRLLAQIEAIDFEQLDDLIARYVRERPRFETPTDVAPAPYYPNDPTGVYDAEQYREAGEALIRGGKVAAFTVAGGQGTRLGWNGPKGTYPATPVTGKPLFRLFAEQIIATKQRYGVTVPWYIMTSPANDDDTRAFIQDNRCFGLDRRNIFMFPQGTVPSIDAAGGKLLLSDKDTIAVNPDGHGGSIKALAGSGAIDDMRVRGIEHISYFQVDNPLVKAFDPLFIGLHATAPDSSAQMSSKMVAKARPEEKVGVFCRVDNKTAVIEYSDLDEELATQLDADGRLRFIAGSIAIHLLSVKFVEQLTDGGAFGLPWHRADKKVPYIDFGTGKRVEPDKPNAVKLETFVFDALPLAESSIVYETSRVEEFAPIKNIEGVDSPASSHLLQSERAGRWLEAAGVAVPRDAEGSVDATIEITPLTALDLSELTHTNLPDAIQRGATIVL